LLSKKLINTRNIYCLGFNIYWDFFLEAGAGDRCG